MATNLNILLCYPNKSLWTRSCMHNSKEPFRDEANLDADKVFKTRAAVFYRI